MKFTMMRCSYNSLIVPAILFAGLVPLRAQEPTPAQYQERIRSLESRVAALEDLVQKLVAEKQPAPAPPVLAPVSNVATPPVRPEVTPPELVPDVGKIGAEVGILLSGSGSPFQLNRGNFFGGFINLPLLEPRWMHGKLGYEIMVGMSQSYTTFNTTSNVAQVANLAVLTALNPNGGLNNVVASVTGTGPAPFPVTASTETRFRLLQVIPFALKYTNTSLDRWRLRPYGVLGFGTYVTIHSQNPARGTPPNYGVRKDAALPADILGVVDSIFGGQAPFGGPLVAGQISQAPELEKRGLPGGHGNIDFGGHAALGLEYRLNRNFSLGFDSRFNKIAGTNGWFRTYGSRIAVHF